MTAPILFPSTLMAFVPLLIVTIPLIFISRKLAIEKGKDVTLFTVLACIPIVNFVTLWYIIGTPSKRLEDKMDRILDALNRTDLK